MTITDTTTYQERVRQAMKMAADRAMAAAALADVADTRGKLERAVDAVEEAAALAAQQAEQLPEDPVVRMHLSRAKNATRASRYLERGPVPLDRWVPSYSEWRHGGWYVDNLRLPSGAIGCVSRNYPDKKWRIVCDPRNGSYPGGPLDHTYPNRDAAARAERELVALGFRY